MLLWIAVGTIIGFALHPHAFEYASFIFDSLLRIPFIPGLAIGNEMHSGIHLGFRVPVMTAALVLLHAGLTRCGLSMKEYAATGLSLLAVLAVCFTAMFFAWSRSIAATMRRTASGVINPYGRPTSRR